jgi:hypothetical protein
MRKNIVFDSRFSISNDDTLYCSEFCAFTLNSCDTISPNFKPALKVLKNRFYIEYLQTENLKYYPVDFFISSGKFKKIFELKNLKN